ncbi:oxidoreductase-like domain-containing protein, partial [Klebsiella pneumoniae]|uniref:oxidoreductase-like domain-containing protein n=1 Tax=Klebsiella pneumoniae TaxID=573 RepID=UPI001D0E0CD6
MPNAPPTPGSRLDTSCCGSDCAACVFITFAAKPTARVSAASCPSAARGSHGSVSSASTSPTWRSA